MICLRHAGIAYSAILAMLLIMLLADRHPARGQEPAGAAAKPVATSCQRSAFRVVVDVGHTVAVPGAISARGVPEYAFNLQLAQDIKQKLDDAGFGAAILLITDKAPPEGLIERAIKANSIPADLFIAIHHDLYRIICCRPGNTKVRKIISTTIILAMPFSSPTTTPTAQAAFCSGGFWARNCKRAACNTRRITRCR